MTDHQKPKPGMSQVFLFDHPVFRQHDTGPGHPERPERLEAIARGIRRLGLTGRLDLREPSPVDEQHLLRIHTEAHVRGILAMRGRHEFIDGDTRVSPKSVEAALIAAGACIQSVDIVLEEPASSVFVLNRPPGHHAESNRAMGFCLFNHVAAAAAYAIAEKGLARVLIFDPDVHHGNGTQEIFYARGDVCYVSIHQWPLFPGTGLTSELGKGEGIGRTVNLPFPAGMGDVEYAYAVERVVVPLVRAFDPQLVIFSAGFDAHMWDPLGGMQVTSDGFAKFYSLVLRELAERRVPSFFCLEGGYSLEALEETVPKLLALLLEGDFPDPQFQDEPDRAVQAVVAEIRRKLSLD